MNIQQSVEGPGHQCSVLLRAQIYLDPIVHVYMISVYSYFHLYTLIYTFLHVVLLCFNFLLIFKHIFPQNVALFIC